ncbi:MAG: GNAT family N-acetyltransferase [Chloroflexota bacterium]|nr:GNAT family N-acetyltransferase [Chloroflexota bacterium]
MTIVLAPGYVIRRPQPTDATAVHALIVASDIAEFGESSGYGIAELEHDWTRGDLDRDTWIVFDPHGDLAGYGRLQHLRHVRIDVEIYVQPAHFGRGIGTTLIHQAEKRAREFVPLAPPSARVVLQNWINALNTDACALLEREGYRPVRYFRRMEIELADEPRSPVWPKGISVRAAAVGDDLRALYETSEETMADHWGHVGSSFEEWQKQSLGQNFDPGLWFLALDGDEPAGIALCAIADGIGWVDTLGVRRPWRRRGLGAALLHHAFREFHRRGLTRVGLGVDAASPSGATRLYEQAGMRVTQHYATYSKELRPGVERSDLEEGQADGDN